MVGSVRFLTLLAHFQTDSVSEAGMGPARKQHDGLQDGLTVAYGDDVTEERVRKIDDLVREEFEFDDWVTVEEEL